MKKSYIIGIIILIIVGLICYFIGLEVGKKSMEPLTNQYKKVIDYYVLIPEEVFSIYGEITKIEGNTLSVETIIEDRYKLPEEWKKQIMKVVVNNETKITKTKTMEPGQEMSADDSGFIEIGFSALKLGNKITATGKENIKNKTEFTASAINVMD